jgi:uncharacterized membrane protein
MLKSRYMGLAVAFGAATGAAIGAATGHMAGWVAVGVAAGALIGLVNNPACHRSADSDTGKPNPPRSSL